MPDRSDEFRSLAAECVAIARTTSDPVARVTLLTMAQKWFDLANGPTTNLDAALREFNTSQMSDAPTPTMQQQQQNPAEEGLGRVLNNAPKSAFRGQTGKHAVGLSFTASVTRSGLLRHRGPCGFANAHTLRRAFTGHVGVTPAGYRKRYARG